MSHSQTSTILPSTAAEVDATNDVGRPANPKVNLDTWRFNPPPVTAEDRSNFTGEQLRAAETIAEEMWYGMDLF
jgi:hypothetical protein